MDETRGFKVAGDAPVIAPVELPDGARDEMVKILAAMISGATPEEIAGYQRDGWPDVVTELLERDGETEELGAHIDLLVAALSA